MRAFLDRLPFGLLLAGLGALYLALDFRLNGPLADCVERANWAATVNGRPITKAEVDLATGLFLARQGMTPGELAGKELNKTRRFVLDGLIDDELVRSGAEQEAARVSEEALEERVRQFESRFAPGELQAILRPQQLPVPAMRAILRDHFRQQAWIEEKIRADCAVSEADAQAWFARNGSRLHIPEQVRARHLFLSAVFGDVAAKERLVPELARQLREGRATFAELCALHSDDERTKNAGGDLGYFGRARLSPDFAGPVFAQEPGQIGEPIRTKLGWHIVRVEEKVPARSPSWEELRADLAVYLENQQRGKSVAALVQERRRRAVVWIAGSPDF